MERELVVEAQDCKPGGTCGPVLVAVGLNLTKISSLTGIVDLPSNIEGISSPTDACLKPFSCKTSGGSRLTRTSSLTSIVDLPVNHKGIGLAAGAGKSEGGRCCKRPSLRNRRKMICCLPVNRRGRSRCPNSC